MKATHLAAGATFAATALVGLLGLMLAPVIVLAGTEHRTDSSPSAIAYEEIPPELLARYISAAQTCRGLPWQVIAAIGFIESAHGTFGGATVDPTTGDVRPPIIGPAIDGRPGFATIADPTSPDGWAHARGPMQFLTTTWPAWAVLGDGRPFDAQPDIDNAWDAIATAAEYLCNNKDEITDLEAAIGRYNHSDTYVAAVLDKAIEYGLGHDGTDQQGDDAETIDGDVSRVLAFALAQLGKPYVWGAEGPDAFDCSGLTLAAYRTIGIRLPHYSSAQARYGRTIDPDTDGIEPGDLIFTRGGVPTHDLGHVGIALDADRYIVAPHTGDVVQIKPIPEERVQAVRRLVTDTDAADAGSGAATPDPYSDADTAPGGESGRWSPQVVRSRINRASAVILAAAFDRIAATPTALAEHVTAMKRVNPKLRLLAWIDVGTITTTDGTIVDAIAAQCRRAIDASGYDGCLLNITITPTTCATPDTTTTVPLETTTTISPATTLPEVQLPPCDTAGDQSAMLEAIRSAAARPPESDGELLVLFNMMTGKDALVRP